MKFTVIDTASVYADLIAAPDAAARETIFRDRLVAPFDGVVKLFGAGDGLAMFSQWGMSPEDFGGDKRAKNVALVEALTVAGAWTQAAEAVTRAGAAFAPYANRLHLNEIVFALLTCDLSRNPIDRGYSGFGGLPGYVMVVVSQASEYALSRIQGATAHELLHNVHFSIFPFNPMRTTVAEYIIAEGLAESFAVEMYGENVLGYMVQEFDQSRFDDARHKISAALDVSGFDTIRAYIFGDTIAAQQNIPTVGLPDFAGYAIGYHVVQAYLRKAGGKVTDAVFVPARQIIAESGFFA